MRVDEDGITQERIPQGTGTAPVPGGSLQVDCRFPRLSDRQKRIARTFLLRNPALFVCDYLEQDLLVVVRRHDFVEMLLVLLVAEHPTVFRVELLSCELTD